MNNTIENIVKNWDIPNNWLSHLCTLLEKVELSSFSLFISGNSDRNKKNKLIEFLENFVVVDDIKKVNIKDQSRKRKT